MNFYNFIIIILFLKIIKNSARDVTDVIHVPRSHRSRFINLENFYFLVKKISWKIHQVRELFIFYFIIISIN